jgi:lipid-A-disaccharide synthase-like uncharacterized protein
MQQMSNEQFWLSVGFVGQAFFSMRFLIQWIASEKRKESVIPISFWFFSIGGATGLLPRQDETKSYAGYGFGALCVGCDLAIDPSEMEYELISADERSYAFFLDCANIWGELKAALADGEELRVTCS